VIAVWMLAAGLEGWLYGVGRIGWWTRAPLLIGAAGLLKPGLETDLVGVAIIAGTYAWHLVVRPRAAAS
jgi:hypothetical protein